MSFIRSFLGTCCGPYIFSALRKNSIGRTLLHLLLLCFLCAVFVGIGNFMMMGYKWRAAYNNFNDVYGTRVSFSEKGVLPEKSPEISRCLDLPYDSLIIYVSPDAGPESYSDEMLERRNIIFLWSSACITAFVRHEDNSWQKFGQYEPQGEFVQSSALMSFAEMRKELQTLCNQPASTQWSVPETYQNNGMTSKQVFLLARLSFSVGKASFYFITGLITVFVVSLLFAISFKVLSWGASGFGFFELWKTAVYVAFPVLAVVCAFPALQLPGAQYFSWLFMIGWVIYLFFVLKYLFLNPDVDNDSNGDANERA